jgi:Anti-sigma regulatory factor (Ser/Thr protein kinase)
MDALSRQAPHRRHQVRAPEDVGALRRAVAAAASGLGTVRPGTAELVATELGTNLVRHTAGGYVLWRRAGDGIELLAVDHGPGMRPGGVPMWALPRGDAPAPWPRRGEGLGAGLAGVRRMASEFDCYAGPGGSVILARVGPPGGTAGGRWRWGAVNVPAGGSGESGDAWAVAAGPRLAALVVDGLGHGPAAAVAARAAVAEFARRRPAETASPYGPHGAPGVEGLVRGINEAMRGTRGGVIGFCLVEPRLGELTFAGVGNVTGRVFGAGAAQSLLGRGGTLGTQVSAPRAHPVVCRWAPGATLVLVSDGIAGRWDPLAYPGLLLRHPAVVAATLQRDHGRGTDDATVLVVQDTRALGMQAGTDREL